VVAADNIFDLLKNRCKRKSEKTKSVKHKTISHACTCSKRQLFLQKSIILFYFVSKVSKGFDLDLCFLRRDPFSGPLRIFLQLSSAAGGFESVMAVEV
jgi:hypothetical protein